MSHPTNRLVGMHSVGSCGLGSSSIVVTVVDGVVAISVVEPPFVPTSLTKSFANIQLRTNTTVNQLLTMVYTSFIMV